MAIEDGKVSSYLGLDSVFAQIKTLKTTGRSLGVVGRQVGGIAGSIRSTKAAKSARNEARISQGLTSIVGMFEGLIGNEIDSEVSRLKNAIAKLKKSGASGRGLERRIGIEYRKSASILNDIINRNGGRKANTRAATIADKLGRVAEDYTLGYGVDGSAKDFSRQVEESGRTREVVSQISAFRERTMGAGGIGGGLPPELRARMGRVFLRLEKRLSSATSARERTEALTKGREDIEKSASLAHTAGDKDKIKAIAAAYGNVLGGIKKDERSIVASKVGEKVATGLSSVAAVGGRLLSVTGRLIQVFGAGVGVFQTINGLVNRFAKQQTAITRERALTGRRIRGSGIEFDNVMMALGAGRKAGMNDKDVVDGLVSLQTELANARWGESKLIEALGRWGGTVFNSDGSVKNEHETMLEFSRVLNRIISRGGSKMEQLQFLSHIGKKPEELEYIRDYAAESAKWDRIKGDKSQRGILGDGRILDESGVLKKIDAATQIELKRREILNQNAILEGPGAALKRAVNPENWFFPDWTARQQGAQTARAEIAQEKLTQAIIELTEQSKKNGLGGQISMTAVAGKLSLNDLRALAHIGDADERNRGEQSHFKQIKEQLSKSTGLSFDFTSPLERAVKKIASLLERLVVKLIDIIENIENNGIGKTAKFVANHPLASGAMALGAFGLLRGGKNLIGSAVSWGGKKLFSSLLGRSVQKYGVGAGITALGSGAARAATTATAATTTTVAAGGAAARMGAGAIGGAVPAATVAASGVPSSGVPVGVINQAGIMGYNPAFTSAARVPLTGRGLALASMNPVGSPSKWSQLSGGEKAERALSKGLNLSTAARIGGRGAAGTVLKTGLKRVPGLGMALAASDGVIGAYQGYSAGDTKAGNHGVGEAIGAAGGFWGGSAAGAALGTLIAPGIGTTIGGILGGALGAMGIGWLGGKGADAISEGMGVKGSSKNPMQAKKADLKGRPIDQVRNLVREGRHSDALELANKSGMKGLSITDISDERFLNDDQFAAETVLGADYAYKSVAYQNKYGAAYDPNVDYTKDAVWRTKVAMGVIKADDQDEQMAATARLSGHGNFKRKSIDEIKGEKEKAAAERYDGNKLTSKEEVARRAERARSSAMKDELNRQYDKVGARKQVDVELLFFSETGEHSGSYEDPLDYLSQVSKSTGKTYGEMMGLDLDAIRAAGSRAAEDTTSKAATHRAEYIKNSGERDATREYYKANKQAIEDNALFVENGAIADDAIIRAHSGEAAKTVQDALDGNLGGTKEEHRIQKMNKKNVGKEVLKKLESIDKTKLNDAQSNFYERMKGKAPEDFSDEDLAGIQKSLGVDVKDARSKASAETTKTIAAEMGAKEFGAKLTAQQVEDYGMRELMKRNPRGDFTVREAQERGEQLLYGKGGKYEGAERDFLQKFDWQQKAEFDEYLKKEKNKGKSYADIVKGFAKEKGTDKNTARGLLMSKEEMESVASNIEQGKPVDADTKEAFDEASKGNRAIRNRMRALERKKPLHEEPEGTFQERLAARIKEANADLKPEKASAAEASDVRQIEEARKSAQKRGASKKELAALDKKLRRSFGRDRVAAADRKAGKKGARLTPKDVEGSGEMPTTFAESLKKANVSTKGLSTTGQKVEAAERAAGSVANAKDNAEARRKPEGETPKQVTLNSNITINGVPTDRAEEFAKAVKNAEENVVREQIVPAIGQATPSSGVQ